MNTQPLVSVFIPYYNDEKYLSIAIESVLNQTYKNWELILLNHATTDNSRNIAHSYNDARIKHIDMPKNYGAGGGILFEKMLNHSSGKYIKPFCADDQLFPDALENLVNYMENNPNIDFAFGNVQYINGEGEDLEQNWFSQRPGFSIKHTEIDLIKKYMRPMSVLPYIGSIIKTQKLRKIKFDYTLIMLFDVSLWLSLLCQGNKIGYYNKIVAHYRIHPEQASSIEKEAWSTALCPFERSIFWKTLFNIEDVKLAKEIFTNNLTDKLKDKKDIPYIIAYSLFHQYAPMTYEYLTNLFNNPEYLQHIEEEFGWGIKELREQIGILTPKNTTPIQDFKTKYIYSKPIKELKFWQLFYLFLKRIIYVISLKPIKKRIRQQTEEQEKQKKFSL